MIWVLFALLAYLLGSIPFGLLIGRAQGIDIRTLGSGNIGATNLGRQLGRKFFFLCFFLDMSKGLLPTVLAGSIVGTLGRLEITAPDAWGWLSVMAAAVLGHMFSPWIGFKGGKGVATALGAMLGIFPALTVPGVGALIVFAIVVKLWRYVSLASCMAAFSLPLWTWYEFAQFRTFQMNQMRDNPQWQSLPTADIKATIPFHGTPFIVVVVALAALVIYKHRGNLARIVAGEEPTISAAPAKGLDSPQEPDDSAENQTTQD
jgi:glycerol-3-phosphate acyltransferase PlsY